MSNNMLGLKIVRIYNGLTDLFEINGNQSWTKKIWDIRKDLNFDNLDSTSTVLMLKCIEGGHILTIASFIDGRGDDCKSAWIYVPASIDIKGIELVEVIELTKKEILATEFDDEKLEQLFSRTYPEAPAVKKTQENTGDKCACRYYGKDVKYELYELLANMNQSYYSNYKSVFLLDNTTDLKFIGDDLTKEKVYSMMLVKAPNEKDGFKPFLNGKQFVGQMYMVEDDILKIEWRKEGYLPISTKYEVKSDSKFTYPESSQYKKIISYDAIQVLDELNRTMSGYKLYIDNQLVERGESVPVNEYKLRQTLVEIQADGYEKYKENCDLTKVLKLKLNKKTYTYEFLLPLSNHKKYPIKITSEKHIKSSPIKGYVIKDDYIYGDANQLVYQPFTRKHLILCMVFVVLSLCVGGCAGWFVKSYFSKSDTKNNNTEITSLKKELLTLKKELENKEKEISDLKNDLKNKPNVNSNHNSNDVTSNPSSATKPEVSVIDYLDNNKKWNRNEMEKYPETKGLWDAMNERRFGDILKYRDNLNDSKNFIKIFKCVENNRHKTGLGKYNTTDSDFDITIDTYMRKLDGAPEPKKENKVKENKEEKETTETNNAESYV